MEVGGGLVCKRSAANARDKQQYRRKEKKRNGVPALRDTRTPQIT